MREIETEKCGEWGTNRLPERVGGGGGASWWGTSLRGLRKTDFEGRRLGAFSSSPTFKVCFC
jgi:hypothetical protein